MHFLVYSFYSCFTVFTPLSNIPSESNKIFIPSLMTLWVPSSTGRLAQFVEELVTKRYLP